MAVVEALLHKITGYIQTEDTCWTVVKDARRGLPNIIVDEVNQLNIPELFFYGSRSKKYIPPDNQESDWDFAFQNNEESVKSLLDNGFKLKVSDDPTYGDGLTFQVFEKQVGPYMIQLVSKGHLEMFKDIWLAIPQDFWETFIWKKSPKYMGKEGVTSLMNVFRYMIEDAIRRPLEDML